MSSPSLPNPFLDDRLTAADRFDANLDVASVHQTASDYLINAILRTPKLKEPDGQAKVAVILSIPGVGKTHVFGRVQHRLNDRALFVFVPQLEEHSSPIQHIHWHLLKTLFDTKPNQPPKLHGLLARLCQHSFRRYFDELPHSVKEQQKALRERLDGSDIVPILEIVAQSKEAAPFLALGNSIADRNPGLHNTVIRALVLGWSPFRDDAWRWLRGEQVDDKRLSLLRLPPSPPPTTVILKTLACLLHRLHIPVVICVDQSDKLLKVPGAMNELTTAMMGWVDSIPNLVLSMSCLKDEWEKSKATYKSFSDRSISLTLDTLKPTEAVDILRRRMINWPGAKVEKGPVYPFKVETIEKLAADRPLHARSLLKMCSAGLEKWLADQSKVADVEDKTVVPPEELFRQEWTKTLAIVSQEKLAPENVQEERLFRMARQCVTQLHESKTSVAGMDFLQVQEDPDKARRYLHLKLGVRGTNDAVPVVVAITKLTGGRPLSSFFRSLEQSIVSPVAGAIVIRPVADKMGATTEGRTILERLKNAGRLRLYELDENQGAFEHMECYVRLLDRAERKELLLGQQLITVEQFRTLAAKTKVLEGLNLFAKICAGWVAAPVAANVAAPAIAATTPPKQVQAAIVGSSSSVRAGATAVLDAPKAAVPAAYAPAKTVDGDWSARLLRAMADKLIEFGQRVEPLNFQLGPTFARFNYSLIGRASVKKIRNHANDLRAHIAGIQDVPVISDEPGGISIDIRRPDRQTVHLAKYLNSAPSNMANQPAFPVGVDVAGKPFWLNLAESSTCHLLTAGTTGSGKSEFLKAMIASLASRLSPLELQLILIDPKRVTFNFSGPSPYLMRPIAYSVEDATPLVQECFAEMERRYKILQNKSLENINQLKKEDALPRIVVIIDEFADLMADKESKRELETLLRRIGALARAAGIHLVLATQRPDKDVVTMLLRSNLPTKICLRVDGERNSKLILDECGGENLLGNGDLFWKYGSGMIRLQSPYVSKAELERLLRIEG